MVLCSQFSLTSGKREFSCDAQRILPTRQGNPASFRSIRILRRTYWIVLDIQLILLRYIEVYIVFHPMYLFGCSRCQNLKRENGISVAAESLLNHS